ncbi:hypothetical protein [Dactylococcopsis salina]|uniref:Uncharacterized protein n=1 Tax=Dactylococcopsis salina (strain PCC 8305) TaxID=13035 RepID=K9YUI5_DACS8|nr:hypothetical protein [Dactylococcopsis salina]AFZ49753.1 hypothetical protein Dacsa_1038 [Dactylococcopsis salina PCC 8305]
MTIKELIQAELERIPEEQLEQVYKLLREFNEKSNESTSDWEALGDLLEECKVKTGVDDLSYQHDHYLHGTPKRKQL